jgi:hypothetical protein
MIETKPVLNQERINNTIHNNKQPERRLTPSGRSAVVGKISNAEK